MSHSIIASVSAVVLSTGDFAEFLTSYNHAAILFSICAGFVASHTIDAPTHARFTVLAVLCGFFMGLCFATKQTIGGGLTLIVVTVMSLVMVHLSGLKRALSFVTLYTLGWLLPVGSLWAWFYENGVLELHFEQVFFSGVGGEGVAAADFIKTNYTSVRRRFHPNIIVNCAGHDNRLESIR